METKELGLVGFYREICKTSFQRIIHEIKDLQCCWYQLVCRSLKTNTVLKHSSSPALHLSKRAQISCNTQGSRTNQTHPNVSRISKKNIYMCICMCIQTHRGIRMLQYAFNPKYDEAEQSIDLDPICNTRIICAWLYKQGIHWRQYWWWPGTWECQSSLIENHTYKLALDCPALTNISSSITIHKIK